DTRLVNILIGNWRLEIGNWRSDFQFPISNLQFPISLFLISLSSPDTPDISSRPHLERVHAQPGVYPQPRSERDSCPADGAESRLLPERSPPRVRRDKARSGRQSRTRTHVSEPWAPSGTADR